MRLATCLLLFASLSPAFGQEFVTLTSTQFVASSNTQVSEPIDVTKGTTEILPSWRVFTPFGQPTTILLEVLVEGTWTPFRVATWANRGFENTSFPAQKLLLGEVSTDTLILTSAVEKVRVRFEGATRIDEFYLSFSSKPNDHSAPDNLPNLLLEPPKHAQSTYPNGGVLCSPTATSMLLGYWANQLQQPQLDLRVPDILPSVWDKEYKGAGNWSFNTSFAGSQPGLVGYATRLRGIADLAAWIQCGVPVATSVSYDLLKGKEKKGKNDGHLVVLVGFDAEGRPVFNDPGRNIVRMTYDLAAFQRAWETSGRTVYLLYPRNWRTPGDGPWRNATKM